MTVTLVAAQVGALVAAPLVVGPSLVRRLAATSLLLVAVILPCFFPPNPFLRGALTYLALLSMMKTTQIEMTPRPWPLWLRAWHGLVPYDVLKTRRVNPTLDVRILTNIFLHFTVLAIGFFVLVRLGDVPLPARGFVRLFCGAAFVYALMEFLSESIRLGHRVAGLEVQGIQHAPILSRSIGEFWRERWNRPVSDWLLATAFLPLARKRYPLLGVTAAFFLSAGIHAYFYAVPLGGEAALSVLTFFVLQAGIIFAEKRMGVRTWPAGAARAWTLILLLICSPLFVEPLLRGAGVR